ncbi:MAG: YceI family protein [Ilumatobacteraceae bacterium]
MAVVCLALIVVAGSFIYAKFINKADEEFDSSDVKDRLTTTLAPDTTTGSDATTPDGTTPVATDPAGTTATGAGVDGEWLIAGGSEVGYRVDESINGFDTTAHGRTQAITGAFTIDGTAVSAGNFTVDMTTFKSDESRRDGQFNGRIMDVANFPTATFVLTAPIDFQQVPTDGTTITATATGDLTLRGTTVSVTFEVEATFANGRVGVLGKIPVVFADFGIPNPSVATITTEDNGLLEFVLIFDRA